MGSSKEGIAHSFDRRAGVVRRVDRRAGVVRRRNALLPVLWCWVGYCVLAVLSQHGRARSIENESHSCPGRLARPGTPGLVFLTCTIQLAACKDTSKQA